LRSKRLHTLQLNSQATDPRILKNQCKTPPAPTYICAS
jgi:hypothetical protein